MPSVSQICLLFLLLDCFSKRLKFFAFASAFLCFWLLGIISFNGFPRRRRSWWGLLALFNQDCCWQKYGASRERHFSMVTWIFDHMHLTLFSNFLHVVRIFDLPGCFSFVYMFFRSRCLSHYIVSTKVDWNFLFW